MMSDYLDTMSESVKRISNICFDLNSLGTAFRTTGNSYMGNLLLDISEDLEISRKNIHNAVGVEIHSQSMVAQQSSANMLVACLSMSELSKEKYNEQ